jgi:hypothetical protein
MTIDEAISYMQNKLKALYESSPVEAFSKDADAYYLAIKALEELKNNTSSEIAGDCVSRNSIIEVLNKMDRYVADELTLCGTERKFSKNEVFIVDDVYEEIVEQLPSVKLKQREQIRWIPVSERLPEQYEEVIVTDIETSDTYQSRYVGDGYWECDNGLFRKRIIAWQPKPKPYSDKPCSGPREYGGVNCYSCPLYQDFYRAANDYEEQGRKQVRS